MSPELETLSAPPDAGSGLRVEVEDLPRWRRRIVLTAPPERVRRVREEVARGYGKRLRLPGFRPGHAPAELVRRRFAAEIEEDLGRRLLRTGVAEALESRGLDPIEPPAVSSAEVDPGDTFRAVVEVDVRPDMRLARTRGFRVERGEPQVDPQALDRLLERLREERAEERSVDRPAVRGDAVVADVESEGDPGRAAAEGWRAVLGDGTAPPEVESRLEGASAGQEVEVEMPGAGPDEPGGRRFRLRVREVRERVLPPLDDAFASSVSKAATLAELRERLAENLREEAAARAERDFRDRLLDAIAEANAVEVPEVLVDRWVAGMLHGSGGHEGHAHGSAAQEDHAHEGGAGADGEAEIRRILRPAAEQGLRRLLVLETVARDAGLEPADAQVDAWIAERLEPGATLDDARRSLERSGRLADLRRRLRDENVFRHLENPDAAAAPAASAEGGA